MKQAIVFLLASIAANASAKEPATCPIPGHPIQWIADYCMYVEQTDDLIAASSCIEREQAPDAPRDACATKRYYKTALCKLHIADGHRSGTVAACVNDKGFSGKIVRDDGAR